MAVQIIPGIIKCLNTSDWDDTIVYLVDGEPRVFAADTTISGALKAVVDGATFKIDITDITIASNQVTHRVPKGSWSGQPFTVYDFSFTEHRSDGVTKTLSTGRLQLEMGPEA